MSFSERLFYFLKENAKKILLNTSKYGWFGDYTTWEEAKNQTTGYDQDLILNKVKDALLKVKNGDAVYERDSVLFNEIHYSWGALAGLLFAASQKNESLTVLDFGGSLGSSYFTNKNALKSIKKLSWNIIEQSHFVNCGKENFSNDQLRFYENIDEYKTENTNTDVLFLSSVIQYIDSPYNLLDVLLKVNAEIIIIDITTFTNLSRDIITIQKVPPVIYDASYPCWFFDQTNFTQYFIEKGYHKMGEWKMPYEINFGFHAGIIFTKTKI